MLPDIKNCSTCGRTPENEVARASDDWCHTCARGRIDVKSKPTPQIQAEQKARGLLPVSPAYEFNAEDFNGRIKELALLIQKADALDWLEKLECAIGYPSPEDKKFYIFTDDQKQPQGYGEYSGETLLSAIQQAQKEQ